MSFSDRLLSQANELGKTSKVRSMVRALRHQCPEATLLRVDVLRRFHLDHGRHGREVQPPRRDVCAHKHRRVALLRWQTLEGQNAARRLKMNGLGGAE